MSASRVERPKFFEGQYLGARDLGDAVRYGRHNRARHFLGAHTWGIGTGLELVEVETGAGGDAIDVYIQPGYAWDGFGRPIVVLAPYKVPPELFKSIPYNAAIDEQSPGGRLVEVWLNYDETATNAPRPGFSVCDVDDQYARVQEHFRVEIGERRNYSDRRDSLTIAGIQTDATGALQIWDENASLLYDTSVPHQEFPEDYGDSRWLVFLGYVRRLPAKNVTESGAFVSRTDEDLQKTRQSRQYIGVVAGYVQAADGTIRMRDRVTNDPATEVWSEDLVWVDGNLRVDGNARLFGTKLTLDNSIGEEDGVPLYLQRAQSSANELSGKDLTAAIGNESDASGANRFVVGTVDGDEIDAKLIVKDDGKVGIQAENPQNYEDGANDLVIEKEKDAGLTIASGAEDKGTVAFARGTDADETECGLIRFIHEKDLLALGTFGKEHVYLDEDGKVGVGTASPSAPLHVAAGKDVTLADDSGRLLIGDVDGLNLVFDGNEIQARDDGSTSTLFVQAEGGDFNVHQNEAESTRFVVKDDGKVGIKTTSPGVSLHVASGSDVTLSDGRGYLVLGGEDGANVAMDNNEIQARDNGSASVLHLQAEGGDLHVHRWEDDERQFMIKADGKVGIGTSSPRVSLHIASGEDVDLNDDDGYLVIGDIDGDNVAFDSNEIQARNDGAAADLTLQAEGGNVGVGTFSPVARLHVRREVDADANDEDSYVAMIENTSGGTSADVLALKIGRNTPGDGNNFVSFFCNSTVKGCIEGNGSNGVAYRSTGADYAEFLPRRHGEEPCEPGDVVGIHGGRVSREIEGADHVLVVSSAPIVLGNSPEGDVDAYEKVAFLGQAPVKVRGKVRVGDMIVPGGHDDGVGVAVDPQNLTAGHIGQCVGTAWEASENEAVKPIAVSIGLDAAGPLRSVMRTVQRQQDEITRLREELEEMKAPV